MKKSWRIILVVVIILIGIGAIGFAVIKKKIGSINVPSTQELPQPASNGTIVSFLKVPDGFKATYFAKDVPGARVMLFDSHARMLVSETDKGNVAVLTDANNDGVAETNTILVSKLQNPHGLALDCTDGCKLYVATIDALMRYDYDDANGTIVGSGTNVMDFQNSATDRHKTRTLLWLPGAEGHTLLISVGSTCNVCDEPTYDNQHGKILAFDVAANKISDYATGLRNAVFMAVNPINGWVFSTEMGRDSLGDDTPPDEINMIKRGANYGWPICYGKNIHDTDFDKNVYIQNPCSEQAGKTPSYIDIPAHSAPLGLAFIPEEGWPEDYWYNLLVAYHGSWNRSTPTGYKIVRMKIDAKGNYAGTEDFITGFLSADGKKYGRPADILVEPGGTIYISDDEAGAIYKISRI